MMSRTERSPSRRRSENQFLFERLDNSLGRAGVDEMLDVVERNGLLGFIAHP